jgi:hypothetical protein
VGNFTLAFGFDFDWLQMVARQREKPAGKD